MEKQQSLSAASFDTAAMPVAAATSFRRPDWILLDKVACLADRPNGTTARCVTPICGQAVEVSFRLADPPGLSQMCVHCPGLESDEFVLESTVVCSEKKERRRPPDLLLLRPQAPRRRPGPPRVLRLRSRSRPPVAPPSSHPVHACPPTLRVRLVAQHRRQFQYRCSAPAQAQLTAPSISTYSRPRHAHGAPSRHDWGHGRLSV